VLSKSGRSTQAEPGTEAKDTKLGSVFTPPLHREDVSKLSPSSLLGEEPSRAARPVEETVGARVSPESLLPPSVDERRLRWRKFLLPGLVAIAVLLGGTLYWALTEQKSVAELTAEAATYLTHGDNVSAIILLKDIVDREPENLDAHLKLAKAYVATGALKDAQTAIQRAQELGAPTHETVPIAARILIDLDRYDEAIKLLGDGKSLLGKLPGHAVALLLGRSYLGLGNVVEARTQFTSARSEQPGEAMTGLARVMALEGAVDGGRQLIEEVIIKYPNIVDAWIAKGEFLRRDGKLDEAIAAYQIAESLAPANVEVIISIAITHIGQGQLDLAQRQLRKAHTVSPNSHLLGFGNAVLAMKEKRYDDCKEWLNAVFSIVPKHLPSIYLAGTLNMTLGHWEQAQDAFTDYLTKVPGSIDARKMLALVLLRKQRPQAAVDVVAPLVDLDLKDAHFYLVAGEAYLQLGEAGRAKELLAKASRLDSSNHAILTTLGRAQMAEGTADTGMAEFEKAVALEPDDPMPYRRLAISLIARGRLDEATTVINKLQKRLPTNPEHHWLRGIIATQRKDIPKARENLEAALKLDPAFFPAAAELARQSLQAKDLAGAKGRFEALLRAKPGSQEATLALARLDVVDGKIEKALTSVQRLAEDSPDSTAAQLMLAELQKRLGQTDAAIGTARRARETNPRDPRAAELLGGLQVEAKDLAGAVQSYSALVSIRPRYARGRMLLAEVQYAAGQRRAAIVTLQEAMNVGGPQSRIFIQLVNFLLEEKKFTEAYAIADQAKQKLPKRSLGYQLEGEIRLAQGDTKQALTLFQAGHKIEPTGGLAVHLHRAESTLLGRDAPLDLLLDWQKKRPNDVLLQFYTADVLVRVGRAKDAMPIYMTLLKQGPADHRLLNNIADAMQRIGDPRALEYAQLAFQSRPNDPIVVATLGTALLQQGKVSEALPLLQNAIKLDPTNSEIRYEFVRALVKAGDRTRAKTALNELLASGKAFPQIAEAKALAGTL